MIHAKSLIPNKEWLIRGNNKKLGGLKKDRKEYKFFHKGTSIPFPSLSDLKEKTGIVFFDESVKKIQAADITIIYGYPCSSKPYQPIYNVKKKLPLYSKNTKSKSQYCAGYYTIKFRKGWVKSFCPKLITLERYPYYGPYKTEEEMNNQFEKL